MTATSYKHIIITHENRQESGACPIKRSQSVTLLHRCNIQKIRCRNDPVFLNHAAVHPASYTFKHERIQQGAVSRASQQRTG
jgi:hypothetical protein